MKKILSAIFAAAIALSMTAFTSFADNTDMLVDEADILSSSEEKTLEKKLNDIVSTYGYDVVILTINGTDGKSMQAYADDYYDYNYYCEDGLILVYNAGTNEAYISTDGKGISAFTDKGISDIGKEVRPMIDRDYFNGAFNKFADLSEEYIKEYEETGKALKKKNYAVIFLISAGIGLVAALAVCLPMKAQLKTAVRQVSAKQYVKSGSRNVTFARDIYLYKKVSREKIESDSGSSTHTGSSGDTHGGGSI